MLSRHPQILVSPKLPSMLPNQSSASTTSNAIQYSDASQRYALRKSMSAFMPYMEKLHDISNRVPEQQQDGKVVSTLFGRLLSTFQSSHIRSSDTESQDQDSSVYGTEDPPRAPFIDPLGILTWLKACESNHGLHCSTQASGGDGNYRGPSWLIDTQQNRLIPGRSRHSYFALSYCWGSSVSTSLTVGNLDALQKRNALNKPSAILPATIKDAMHLVLQLKGRYLWVDKLCIPQDDIEVKKRELESMAMIYACAHVTIIAAQGSDANDGLRGIQGGAARDDEPPSPFGSVENMMAGSIFEFDINDRDITSDAEEMEEQSRLLLGTTWSSRGWTFQEHLFSLRKLIFQNDTVNWDCHCAAWHEMQADLGIMARQPCSMPLSSTGFNTTAWPDFHRFSRLVSIYNKRDLTFEEDVLDAFAGALNVFGRSFEGGFVSGLPQMFFDAALIWQPHRRLARRQSSKSDQAVLPSWSWIGWHGTLHSESWRSGYSYIRRNPDEYVEEDPEIWQRCSWRTISTIKWLHSVSKNDSKLRIPVGKTQPPSLSGTTLLSEGWTQRHCEVTNQEYFVRESDSTQEFWYPIAIKDRISRKHMDTSVRSRFLHCRTRRGYLSSEWTDPHPQQYGFCPVVKLMDGSGVWAGALRLNLDLYDDIPDEYYKAEDIHKEAANALVLLEFIEISRGEVENQITERVSFDEWYWPECPRYSGLYKFYNVMCIEWKDGIAYRKAVGRVVDHVWERIATEEIDVTIG